MKIAIRTILFSLILGMHSFAFLRSSVTDKQAVARAQLIVIGHLKKESLVRSPKDQYRTSTSAVLTISKVLKGPFAIEEVPIEIVYGLTPVAGGNTKIGKAHLDDQVKAGEIRIYDTGNSILNLTPITGDLNQDQIWLLRVNCDGSGSAAAKLRVYDPEDIQPILKEDVILGLIEENRAAEKKQPVRVEQVGGCDGEKPRS
jgi:hypothetical protein